MKRTIVEGIVKRHPDGFGFLIVDDPEQPDVYIPRQAMNGVMTNDRIAAEIFQESGGDRYRGEVIRVVKRALSKVVGRLHVTRENTGTLRDEAHSWGASLRIAQSDFNGAKDGDLVAAEILTYPDGGRPFTGRVVEVIGDADDPLNDVKRVIHSQGIPNQFSPETLREAEALGTEVSPQDISRRKDLRELNFITIDGVTARDFDDAIYVENTRQGFKLWVAIADVSHYVKPNSAIDRDAYERGTSVYFPNFVVPMLPEALSNELCSLKPNVPRLTLVAEMDLSFQGDFIKSEFYEAVIQSQARVTYGEAQEVIDGQPMDKLNHVAAEIRRAADLARILMARRFRNGSLDLEVPESQLQIDEAGQPVDIVRSERLFAHRLIEEMMLAANVAVAEFFNQKEVPAMYRIHEEPSPDAIENLQRFLFNFGGVNALGGGKLQKKLTRALQSFGGKPQAQILNILTLRTMKQARYAADNVGHFGLGFSDYTHFTSPIRRYPDLIVHRLIKALIQVKGYRLMNEDDLATAGTMLSAAEQRAVKAERQLMSIKKARFMQARLGEEFDGIISSVTKFGVFVLLRDFDVDGLVKVEALGGGERFEFDSENLRLVGRRSGFSFEIGDPIRILVAQVDPEAGQIDFVLAEEQPEKAFKSASRPAVKASREQERSDEKPQKGRRTSRKKHREEVRAETQPEGRRSRGRKNEGRRSEKRQSEEPRAKGRPSEEIQTEQRKSHPFERFLKKTPPKPQDRSVREQFLTAKEGAGADEDNHGTSKPKSRKLRGAELFSVDETRKGGVSGLVRKLKVSTRGVKLEANRKKTTDRQDGTERGPDANHRGGVRKARVSKRR